MSTRITTGKRKRDDTPLQVSSRYCQRHGDQCDKCKPTYDSCVILDKHGLSRGESQAGRAVAETGQEHEHDNVSGDERPGEHFGIRWHGPTCIDDLMQIIPGVENLANDVFRKCPDIDRIRGYMNEIEYYGQHCGDNTSDAKEIHSRLVSLLPSKDATDDRVRLFHDVYGKVYHVFHLPTFWLEYERLWEDLETCPTRLLAIVLLMVAASRGLSVRATSSPPRDGSVLADHTVSAENAIRIVALSERAIKIHDGSELSTRDLQARFLLAFTKIIVLPKFKNAWVEVQSLVQSYICEGLHRDPDIIHLRISAREKEIRRRIWYTAMELHVQVSVDHGISPLPWPLRCDCEPPRNIVDSDIDMEDADDVLPQARPARHRTHVSYLVTAEKSLPFRYKLSQVLNDSKEPLAFQEAKSHTDEIHSFLDKVPTWATATPDLPRALLILNLNQYILMIHAARIYRDPTRSGRQFSAMMMWEAASETIKIHSTFWNDGQLALQSLCNDFLRAAFCICQIMVEANEATNESQLVAMQLKDCELMSLLDQAVNMTTNKLIQFGRERRNLFIILVAREYVRSKQNEKGAAYMESVIRPMVDACQRLMESRATGSTLANTT